MNNHVHVFVLALLDPKVILCSLFEEPPNCFPQWLYHFAFPLAGYESSNFSVSSPTLNVCVFLFYPSQWVWGGTSLWFWLTVVMLSIFMLMFIGHLYIFLGEMSFQDLCQFLNCVVCLFVVDFYDISTYSGHWILVRSVIASIFSHSVDGLSTTLIVSFDSKSV